MILEQKIDLLLTRDITHTQFGTISVPATALLKGVKIGQGKCRAVVLYLNSLALNTTTNAATAAILAQVYYGDSRSQFRELIRGQQSDIIFCTDLSQVYVRGNGTANKIQATIYLTDEDDGNLRFTES
jgi:hypothetical protein